MKPTQRVKCCVYPAAPETPEPVRRRTTASSVGKRTMVRTMTTSVQGSRAVPAGFSSGPSCAPAMCFAAAGSAAGSVSAKATPTCSKRLTSAPASISVAGILRPVKFFALLLLLLGCSPKRIALNTLADAFSSSGEGGAFARDDDPELVRDAVPFALKTMEGLADSLDDHGGLRLSRARGFTQDAYAFGQAPAARAAPPGEAPARMRAARRVRQRARPAALEG